MPRLVAIALLSLAMWPAAASAQRDEPLVEVVEVTGVVDRPLERYALERIDEAERDGATLVVIQLSSGGFLKISDDDVLPPLVRRIRDARVPIAVHVGPRAAEARGGAVFLLEAAHVASVGPSARIGPPHPLDAGRRRSRAQESRALDALAAARGRTAGLVDELGANASLGAGLVDLVVPGVDELLRRLDGRSVTTGSGTVTLRLPPDGTTVRFHQPGPIRRFLHTLAHPALAYVLLLAGGMLGLFDVFQRGFGVAGGTAILSLAGAAYGLTVLPVRAAGLSLVLAGMLLLAWDVAVDALGVRTIGGAVALVAGSLLFLPPAAAPLALPPWLIGLGVAACLVMSVPVMTVVRRARVPIATEVRRRLVGEPGHVRSVLNPEGFVWVDGELWRARSQTGRRMRVGESVVVTAVEGTLLLVREGASGNGHGSS